MHAIFLFIVSLLTLFHSCIIRYDAAAAAAAGWLMLLTMTIDDDDDDDDVHTIYSINVISCFSYKRRLKL